MGHLINIANQLVTLCSSTSLGQFLKDNLPEVSKSLDEFRDSALLEINKTQEMLLVSLCLINKFETIQNSGVA